MSIGRFYVISISTHNWTWRCAFVSTKAKARCWLGGIIWRFFRSPLFLRSSYYAPLQWWCPWREGSSLLLVVTPPVLIYHTKDVCVAGNFGKRVGPFDFH